MIIGPLQRTLAKYSCDSAPQGANSTATQILKKLSNFEFKPIMNYLKSPVAIPIHAAFLESYFQ